MQHQRKRKVVRFLTVNDVYSFNAVDGHGGWARAISLLRQLRLTLPPADHQLVVACGDILGGSALLNHTRGHLAIDCLNLLPFDAVVLGNHEFDYGVEALTAAVQRSKSIWYGANVTKEGGERLPYIEESQVVELGDGLRLGLFGLCTPATPHLSNPGPCKFENPVNTAKRILPQMNAHVNVALTHLSMHQDQELAEACPQLDLILGGHDHDPYSFRRHRTLIFKTGMNAYWIGIVELVIEYDLPLKPDNINVFSSWEMKSTAEVLEDENVVELVQKEQRLADASMMEKEGDLMGRDPEEIVAVLTSSSVPLDTRSREVRTKNSSSGNLVADALRWYHVSECDLAVINGGFIRGDRFYTPGEQISLRDVLQELPFPRTSCCLRIRGEHLLQALEQQLSSYPEPSGSFPHLSGNCRLVFNMESNKARINLLSIDGKTIDPNESYNVALTDFMASGGDGCSAWSLSHMLDANVDRPYKRIALLVLDYLAQFREIKLCSPKTVCLESKHED